LIGGAIGWQHGFGTLDPVGTYRFAGGDPFTILSAGQSRSAGIVDVDARLRLAPNITLGVSYDGVLGTLGQDRAVKGAFRIAFWCSAPGRPGLTPEPGLRAAPAGRPKVLFS
jgi:fibronectin-binding autotransporter adhesin